MTPALFSGALTSIGVRVDRDQGQLQRGSRDGRLIVRDVLSALCVLRCSTNTIQV